jgi:hypothetical protein
VRGNHEEVIAGHSVENADGSGFKVVEVAETGELFELVGFVAVLSTFGYVHFSGFTCLGNPVSPHLYHFGDVLI